MLYQSLKMAFASIRTSKMRSFLTMLGIIIGVFSLVVLVSIVHGATGSITDEISGLGTLGLEAEIFDTKGKPDLTIDDLNTIQGLESVDEISPAYRFQGKLRSGHESKNSYQVIGAAPSYYRIKEQKLLYGRYIKSPDMENHLPVAVVNETVIREILRIPRPAEAVGQSILLNGNKYEIIGVLEDNELYSAYGQTLYEMHIPFTNAIRLPSNTSRGISEFCFTAVNNEMGAAKDEVGTWLEERFGKADECFYINNNQEYLESMQEVTGILSLVMGGVAAISLLVGGIGIMNIMLVSVTERTREIGIRKAIGATRGVILTQFLLESLTVSLVGCMIGVLLSGGALHIANMLQNSLHLKLVPSIVVIAMLFSSGIGLIFGAYPANKAARMKPIDALRYTG